MFPGLSNVTLLIPLTNPLLYHVYMTCTLLTYCLSVHIYAADEAAMTLFAISLQYNLHDGVGTYGLLW